MAKGKMCQESIKVRNQHKMTRISAIIIIRAIIIITGKSSIAI